MSDSYAMRVTLEGKDKLSPTLRNAAEGSAELGKRLEKINAIGKMMTARVTAPVVAFGINAFWVGSKIEESMTRANMALGATGDEYSELRKQAMEIGRSGLSGVHDTVKAQEELARGFRETGMSAREVAAEVQLAIPAALRLARIAQMDAAQSARELSEALDTYGLKAKDSNHVASALVVASQRSGKSIADYVAALSEVGPAAKRANIPLEDTLAALTVMAQQGVEVPRAATTIKNALLELSTLNGKKSARKVLVEMGLEHDSFLTAEEDLKSIQALIEQLGGASNSQLAQIFGKETAGALGALFSAGEGDFSKTRGEIKKASKEAEEEYQKLAKNAAESWRKLKGSWEALMVSVGDSGLVDGASWVMQKLAGAVGWLSEQSKGATRVVGGMLAVLAAVGPTMVVFGPGVDKVLKFAKGLKILKGVKGGFSFLGSLKKVGPALKHLSKLKSLFALVKMGIGKFAFLGRAMTALIPIIKGVGLALVATPIGQAAIAAGLLAGAGYLIYKKWGPIKSFFLRVKDAVISLGRDGLEWLQSKLDGLAGWVVPAWLQALIKWYKSDKSISINSDGMAPPVSRGGGGPGVQGPPGAPGAGGQALLRVELVGDKDKAKVTRFESDGMDIELDRGVSMGLATG